MWGAFGAMPIDDPPAPAGPPQQAMGPDGASQFVPPVHAVKVSTDGLVYVADRGGRRVQVFTIAGKFVNQVFIGRECHAPDCGNGQTAAGLAFSPDREQRYLYVANRSQAQIMVFNRKTLSSSMDLDHGAQERDNSAPCTTCPSIRKATCTRRK